MAALMRLLFLRRSDCEHSDKAEQYLRLLFDSVTVVHSRKIGDRLPEELGAAGFDALFAFRSHIIIPRGLIERTKVCLNFHPGPPERPGIGCVNFALYEDDEQYGSTCHYIVEQVDAGPIVSVKRFPIDRNDDVASLLGRSYDYLLCQLYDVAPIVASGAKPEPCGEQWTRKATRKKDLDKLMTVAPDAPADEIERVVRATTFGNFGPHMTTGGTTFRLLPSGARLPLLSEAPGPLDQTR
jgi:methionyl-tRNA formyltransferase